MPLSLLEQKKLQWAKEREEDLLWNPWEKPKPPIKSSTLSFDNSKSSRSAISPDFTRTIASGKCKSECHLPPIGKPQPLPLGSPYHGNFRHEGQYYPGEVGDYVPLPAQRKASLPVCFRSGSNEDGHLSVVNSANPHASQRYAYYENDNEHTSGYFSENNGFEEAYFRTGNHIEHPDMHGDNNRPFKTPEPVSYVSRFAETKTDNYGRNWEETQTTHRSSGVTSAVYNYNNNEPPQYDFSYQKSRSQPPPPAMRSSFQVGVDGPQAEILNQKLQEQEKQNWLRELDQQREMDRKKKQMEREDKRPRWGDKGIGVGHFWEPSTPNSHLPTSPSSRDENQFHSPAWLEKSLNNNNVHSSAKSQSTHCLNDPNACLDTWSNDQTTLFSRSVTDLKFIGFGALNSDLEQLQNPAAAAPMERSRSRTFLLGHNVQVDPEELAEKQRKQQAAMEHREAVRRQMEERQAKLKQDREKELAEEIMEENRIAAQRMKELQRLEMEKRKANIRDEQQKEESLESSTEMFLPVQRNGRQMKMQENTNYGPRYGESSRTDTATATEPQIETKEKETSTFLDAELPEFFPGTSPLRLRSSSSRDCGIQTEPENVTKNIMKVEKSPSKTAKANTKAADRPPAKPRWGASPPKKQYVKQSEKDPTYQLKMKKRLERAKQMQKQRVNIDTNSESEDRGRPPHAHTQASKRFEAKSRFPAVNNISATSAKKPERNNNVKINTRNRLPKIEPEPKIELLSAAALEFDGNAWPTSEDESGAILSTPSLGSIYNSNSDFALNGHEHDERRFKSSSLSELESLTNAATSRQRYEDEERIDPQPEPGTRDFSLPYSSPSSSEFENQEPLQFTNRPEPEHLKDDMENEPEPANFFVNQQQQRCSSPPVPAVLRKIRAGIHPISPQQYDEYISRERLPLTPVSSPRWGNESPRSNINKASDDERNRSRSHSRRSPVRKSETFEIPEFGSYGSSLTVPGGNESREEQVISPRSFSINRGESLITQIMSTREVQHQLSARTSELTQEGIIKFSVTVPAFPYSDTLSPRPRPQEVYKDPLISERENSTLRWLHSNQTSAKSAGLAHLSYLKKGIQNQQQEWGLPVEEV